MLECVVFYGYGSVGIGPPWFSRTGLFSKAGRRLVAHCGKWVQLAHMRCLCGISRFFFCQIADEKKSTFELSVHHADDYRFAFTIQESFKTLPPLFNVGRIRTIPTESWRPNQSIWIFYCEWTITSSAFCKPRTSSEWPKARYTCHRGSLLEKPIVVPLE